MDIILCHTSTDFDTLGAAVGLTHLLPEARIVLGGGYDPSINNFLALHRDDYALMERCAVNPEQIQTLTIVNTQSRERLGEASLWLDLPHLEKITVYDSHINILMDIPATQAHISSVGATTTLIVEELQARQINLTPSEATVMALGIHVSTGSLTLDNATARDATAVAWLMQQANLRLAEYIAQIPQLPTARALMSSPVRTIRPETTIKEAQQTLLRYGHSGLSVVDTDGNLVGIVSRRDIDIALHHGFSHAPVQGYMRTDLKTITVDTTLPEIQALMVTYDIGRLPVLANGQLVGIITRTDVLREVYQERTGGEEQGRKGAGGENSIRFTLLALLRDRLASPLWELLASASSQAEQRGWHLYLVGGAVRDLLLAKDSSSETLMITDIDLVVDGFHQAEENVGAGVELARALGQLYPSARLEIHDTFQTAALLWHQDQALGSLWVDIATARTEFYPYPAANPEVEASSIRQDLYRRDFTINALAVRLTSPRAGELLDFFGGLLDLQDKQIRVLHTNSFIEDPTRIYRAVRFAVRLGFHIEAQTEGYIRYALASGIYDYQGENGKTPALQTRLKSELKYILQASYWKAALQLLGKLGALRCIHPSLELNKQLWRQLRLVERCLRHDSQQILTPWLLLLEVILAQLIPEYRGKVASNLQLPDESTKRLLNLAQSQAKVMESLPVCQLPSQVVQLLRRYDLPTLILISVQSPRFIRRQIWQYITRWANVQPPLNGHDLTALGYNSGPQFRQILAALLAATLDGVISDRVDAEEFLLTHYPH